MSSNRLRRALATAFAATLALGGVVMATSAPVAAAEETTTGTHAVVTDATFIWGINGYAQVGIFGPWNFKDVTGDATFLEGSVVGTATPTNPNPQTEYSVDPVPATSFPTSKAGRQPNAIKFSEGTGTKLADGSTTISWDGSYTINAYPAMYNAPNEIYADPQLTINADGSGQLTFDFTLGAGVDMIGNPVEAEPFGRLPLANFSAGDITVTGDNEIRVNPDYQGVENGLSGQNTTCTTANGGTGWWGSFPQEFIDAIDETAVVAHFYSTGCGGMQDNKPPLPFDVSYDLSAPTVTLSETVFDPEAEVATITVTGTGFLPELSQATRAPVCGAGPPAPCGKSGGYYVAFGKVADVWQPSTGAASSTRSVVNGNANLVKWANPASNGYLAPGGANVVLAEDGSFTTTLTVDKAAIDDVGSAANNTQYGVIVYPASGGVTAVGEVLAPVTFDGTDPGVELTGPTTAVEGDDVTFSVAALDEESGIASVEYSVNASEWAPVVGTEFTLDEVAVGEYDVAVRATNGAGRTGSDSATLTVEEAPVEPIDFNDVADDHVFSEQIDWLSTTGITTGYLNPDGSTSFRPSEPVLREQMAAFLYRFAFNGANPPEGSDVATFADVPATHVFTTHIAWLASTGITTGYEGNTYRPAAPVLREQMAAFLYRLADEPEFSAPTTSPFTDLSTSHTFYKEITWLASTGVTTGYDNGNGTRSFKGSDPVLREQMAAFLFRFNNLELGEG